MPVLRPRRVPSKPARELTRGLGVDPIVEVGGAGTRDESLSAIVGKVVIAVD